MAQNNKGEYLQPKTITPKVFKYLKRIAEQCAPYERLVILSFNVFPFSHFVNVNPDRRQYGELLPSHLVIPCLRFVCDRRFHFLGSLFFYREYWENNKAKFSKDMSECIKLYILALANVNLKVVATVTPYIDIFAQAIKILTHLPYLEDHEDIVCYDVGPNMDIIHIHDPMGMQTQLVNLFLKYDFHYKLYGIKYRASKDDILECLRLDNMPLISRDPEAEALDQGESIGEYYFSIDTCESIRRHIRSEALPAEALGTRLFIGNLRGMFHDFYANTTNAKYLICDANAMVELVNFLKSITMRENKTADIERPKVDPRKSKTVRNMKDIDSFISKQKAGKTADGDSALFKENAKKLEYSIYSEMCNTPDDVQNNPNVLISTASGKTLSADSPGTKKKKKKRNAPIPPEIRKELIRARIAAAEASKLPTPPKAKAPMNTRKVHSTKKEAIKACKQNLSSPAKTQKADNGDTTKLSTPTQQQIEKSNSESPTIKKNDEKITDLPIHHQNKKQKKARFQSNSTRDEQLENTEQKPEQEIDIDIQQDPKQVQNKDCSLNKQQSNLGRNNDELQPTCTSVSSTPTGQEIATMSAENMPEQPVKETSKVESRSPVDLEISEALIMLSGQPQAQESSTKIQEKINKVSESEFDDLPDLVEDSDVEIAPSSTSAPIPVTVGDYEASLSREDNVNEAAANNEEDQKNKEAETESEIDSDELPDLVEDSDTEVKKSSVNRNNIIEDEPNDSIEHPDSTIQGTDNMENTEASASSNTTEIVDVPDLVRDLKSTLSSMGFTESIIEQPRTREDLMQICSDILKSNADKLSAAVIFTEEVESELCSLERPNLEIPFSTTGDHTYAKSYEPEQFSETTRETLNGRRGIKEGLFVEKTEQTKQLPQKEVERKHLSPLQTTNNLISPSSGTKKKIKSQLDKVKKLQFDNESDKENLEEMEILNPETIASADFEEASSNIESIINDAKSVSSLIDMYEKERNLRIALGIEKPPDRDTTDDFQPSDLISKDSMDLLIDKYLTQDQITDLLGTEAQVDSTSKLDSVVQCLRKTNTQNTGKMKSLDDKDAVPPKPEQNLIKISWKDGDTVSIQKVNADSVKPLPKDPFKKTDLRDDDNSKIERNEPNNVKSRRDINKEEENHSDHSTETLGSIPDFPDEFDDDAPAWSAVDEQIKLLVESMDDDKQSGSNKLRNNGKQKISNDSTATKKLPLQSEMKDTSNQPTRNENDPSQDEMRKTGAIKKTYERKTKESKTVVEDFKSNINFKKFVNALGKFLKELSRKFYLPYSPEEYLEKTVEECEKFFRERSKSVKPENYWKEATINYTKLFRSLLGERLHLSPKVQSVIKTVIPELEVYTLLKKEEESDAEGGSSNNKLLTIKCLWVQNLMSMKELFVDLRKIEVFDELAPDLFKTDHVNCVMRHVLKHVNDPYSLPIEEDCEPLDVRECFDNLKAYASVLLVE